MYRYNTIQYSMFVGLPTTAYSGHLSESVFFHLKRFAAIASCCWKAFLTNVKSVDGSIFCVICDHLLINFPSNASFTVLNVFPWILREAMCSTAFSLSSFIRV